PHCPALLAAGQINRFTMHGQQYHRPGWNGPGRRGLRTGGIIPAIICCLGLLSSQAQPVANAQRPNIVLIYADDMGYGDLSSYGGDTPTPDIYRIGKAGIRFAAFYVSAPVCTPSR